MSRCIPARVATIALRKRGGPARVVDVAFPADWSRSTFLAYARAEHKPVGETVRILHWDSVVPGEPCLWLANPDGFTDYQAGKARA